MEAARQIEDISILVIELSKGKLTVGLRLSDSPEIYVFEGWEGLIPYQATELISKIVNGQIKPEDMEGTKYTVYLLPLDYDVIRPQKETLN